MIKLNESEIDDEVAMAWIAPKYSKSQIDKAGAALAAGKPTDDDFLIIDNWRASHN